MDEIIDLQKGHVIIRQHNVLLFLNGYKFAYLVVLAVLTIGKLLHNNRLAACLWLPGLHEYQYS